MFASFIFFAFVVCAVVFAIDEKNVLKKVTAGSPAKNNYKSDGIIREHANSNSTVKSYGWVEYKQCDSRWANQRLGWCDGWTLCNGGTVS